jgi:RHS repeat-associated protein
MSVETRAPDGGATTQWVDGMGRVVATERPNGAREENVYGGSVMTDAWVTGAPDVTPIRRRTHLEYDDYGKLVGMYGPGEPSAFPGPQSGGGAFDGYTVRFARGAAGRLEAIDAGGEVTDLGYDAVSGLLSRESYHGITRTMVYEAISGVSDAYPRLIATEEEGRGGAVRRTERTYDAVGRLARELVTNGERVVERRWRRFHPSGRATQEISGTGDEGGTLVEQIAYQWELDLNGRPTARTHRVRGAAVGRSQWRWYRNGFLLAEKGPFGRPVEYEYGLTFDRALDRVFTPDDGRTVAEIAERDAAGRATRVELADGELVLGWNAMGGVAFRERLDAGGDLKSRWEPTYDGLARIGSETRTEGGATWSTTYGYDPTGFLTREIHDLPAGEQTVEYGLNTAGGRLTTRVNGELTTEVTYDTAQAVTRVTAVNGSAIEYDPWAGVLADQYGIEYEREADGQVRVLRRGGLSVEIARDPSGMPVAMAATGGRPRVTTWRLDPTSPPLEVREPGGAVTTWVAADGMLVSRLIEGSGVPTVQDALTNQVVTLMGLEADEPGPLTAFGGSLGAPIEDEWFRFGGMESVPGFPEVYLARHRAYDAGTGRFLRPDPVGLAGGFHRTLYAEGDPVQFNDPLGWWACPATPSQAINLDWIDIRDRMEPVDVYMLGDLGNLHYEITQFELAHGVPELELPDLSGLDLGTILDPQSTDPCGFMCPPPGGDGDGLPDDDINPGIPGFPGPWMAKGDRAETRKDRRQRRKNDRRNKRQKRREERAARALMEVWGEAAFGFTFADGSVDILGLFCVAVGECSMSDVDWSQIETNQTAGSPAASGNSGTSRGNGDFFDRQKRGTDAFLEWRKSRRPANDGPVFRIDPSDVPGLEPPPTPPKPTPQATPPSSTVRPSSQPSPPRERPTWTPPPDPFQENLRKKGLLTSGKDITGQDIVDSYNVAERKGWYAQGGPKASIRKKPVFRWGEAETRIRIFAETPVGSATGTLNDELQLEGSLSPEYPYNLTQLGPGKFGADCGPQGCDHSVTVEYFGPVGGGGVSVSSENVSVYAGEKVNIVGQVKGGVVLEVVVPYDRGAAELWLQQNIGPVLDAGFRKLYEMNQGR